MQTRLSVGTNIAHSGTIIVPRDQLRSIARPCRYAAFKPGLIKPQREPCRSGTRCLKWPVPLTRMPGRHAGTRLTARRRTARARCPTAKSELTGLPGHTIRKYQQFPACAGGQSDRSPGEPSQSTDHPGTGRSPCGLPARSTRGPPLYDFATPLLRHETGDEAECAGACPCGWNSLSARASSGERSTSCSRSAAGKPWPMRSGPPQQPHGNQKALRNQKALHRRIARVSCGLHSR